MSRQLDQLRHDAIAIFDAAVLGVEPRRALTRALATTPPPERVRVIGLGKAAYLMAAAAVHHLDRLHIPVAGGLVVTPDEGMPPDPRLVRVAGDHPLPGRRSQAAAAALATEVARVQAHDEVWILLSGGTTSLIGAPIEGISPTEYQALLRALGEAGLPIGDLNRIRKRFSQWGAGRLAHALRGPRLRVFALSDVPGDDPADIGSGPAAPDPSTAAEIRTLLRTVPGSTTVPEFAFRALERIERGDRPETPKAGDPAFSRVVTRLIGSNALARRHAAERARALGYWVVESDELLTGDAAETGRRLGGLVAGARAEPRAWIWGGETTVSLGAHHGLGGRCQELVLAAAEVLAASPEAQPIVFLAAGTDGRDGPTDAAGGLVDRGTWSRIAAQNIDPARALTNHDAHPTLAAVSGLLRPGLTGTNVMDIVIALTTSVGRSERETPLREPIVGA